MSPFLSHVLLGLYLFTLLGMCVFGLHKVKMLWLYMKGSRRAAIAPPPWTGPNPMVCIQLPLFNEPLVVEALLEKVSAIRWHAGLLLIQVLDDSNDETSAIIDRWMKANPERAACMVHIRRTDRSGYKAGALAYANTLTDAEFFAIFDADFRPEPDFLEVMMPQFADPQIGVVQARWEFNNRKASFLTRFQGIFLDAHFVVEQSARCAAGLFFNFNGTAGIWRRAALEEAGGWTPDTVTEDLDVSYRAQLKGWRFVYLPEYSVPSELPENLTAFKSQQRRWTKGGIQVMRKQLGTILRSDVPARIKREAASHLLVGFIHPLLVIFSVIFVPYLLFGARLPGSWMIFNPVVVVLTSGATVALYITGQYFRQRQWKEGVLLFLTAPFMLAFGLAMSVTCCVAVCEGLFQRGGEFVRTPKGGRAVTAGGLVSRLRSRSVFAAITVVELVLGGMMLAGAIHFEQRGLESIAIVLVVKAAGFLGLALISTGDLLPRFGAERA
ncbi:glycosyltransferase family 2 protein [Rariglobus hedericola]|uniref:Glycosyltransferase n=1 Tax=Rariglobus hedericola TaxID=2597822 RepID=A0A556QGK4_9BACT|nr:glycosyltransferase family 2 protein [Rariglobus hedericola]TSJ75757.1 glycosyltransferase [Rariglobus hedericola]